MREAIRFVGLDEDVLDKSPFELSGGQKRRVAIAGVVAMRPEVLVLDEPAAGLDPRGRREILGGLSAYVNEHGGSVILVSHSMEDMAYYCDDVVVMKGGRVALSGTVSEVFSNHAALTDAGLDVPASLKIAEALSRSGISLSGELYTVSGLAAAIAEYGRRGQK